jgi:hypothetical protein
MPATADSVRAGDIVPASAGSVRAGDVVPATAGFARAEDIVLTTAGSAHAGDVVPAMPALPVPFFFNCENRITHGFVYMLSSA